MASRGRPGIFRTTVFPSQLQDQFLSLQNKVHLYFFLLTDIDSSLGLAFGYLDVPSQQNPRRLVPFSPVGLYMFIGGQSMRLPVLVRKDRTMTWNLAGYREGDACYQGNQLK